MISNLLRCVDMQELCGAMRPQRDLRWFGTIHFVRYWRPALEVHGRSLLDQAKY